ncbi:methyltransferase domain-containing protein [Embleya scabrispora]|uniref:methyltransferase domain-containing protein n=1 Tax=Embleya scabrispora TaxID=159449 RepID=UPI002AA576DB
MDRPKPSSSSNLFAPPPRHRRRGVCPRSQPGKPPEPGHRVLELGTGTRWNAALAARRARPGNVVGVEVDPDLAEGARKALAAAGLDVSVEVGDGAAVGPGDLDLRGGTRSVGVNCPGPPRRSGGHAVGAVGHVALTVADDKRSASYRRERDEILVYDRPNGADGIRWRDPQTVIPSVVSDAMPRPQAPRAASTPPLNGNPPTRPHSRSGHLSRHTGPPRMPTSL